jgi:aspartyl-tRNA(Asn)/glutamyl-tRNA(Gln) amidotransferase subunit A
MHGVPVDGIVPLCRSFDHAGPIARTVRDAALLYDVLHGSTPGEGLAQTYQRAGGPPGARGRRGGGRRRARAGGRLRVGWPKEYFFERVAPEVRRAVGAARQALETAGVPVEEVSIPRLAEGNSATVGIALAEAYQFHRAAGYYPARAAEYSEEVRARLERGERITAADYLDARDVCRAATREFWNWNGRVDAFLVPTVPIAAPRIGEEAVTVAGETENSREALLRLCRTANYTGMPAITVPCGATPGGLPVGAQLIGFWWHEAELLWLAERIEEAALWRPPRGAVE